MTLLEVHASDHHHYDQFVLKHPLGSIHQTWKWGLFQSQSKNRDRFWVIILQDKHKNILASALLIRQKLPFKKCWFYCPRGPLVDYTKLEHLQWLFKKITEIAKQQNALFLRFDPGLSLEQTSRGEYEKITANLRTLKAIPAHAHYQPENTLILNLEPSEEEILKQMKPKGRYNIKVAQKHGINIRLSDNKTEDVEAFYHLLQQTTSRDRFSGHPLDYYQNLLRILNPEAKLYLAEYNREIIAGIIVTFFKDTAIYYFGASGNTHRNTMAPYLLQWKALTDAKKQGYHYYDFLGIAPENEPDHPWAGVTDFKLKFGGQRLDYLSAQEIIYQKAWYQAMKVVKHFRK